MKLIRILTLFVALCAASAASAQLPGRDVGNADESTQRVVLANNQPSVYRQPAQGAAKAQIKGSAGALQGYNFINPNTYPVYAKLYNALAASVTVGTTVPVRTIAIPAGGFVTQENAGVSLTDFSTGITIAVTKLIADNDATALDTAILAEVVYK